MRRTLQMLLVALTILFVPIADALEPEGPHCFPGVMKDDSRGVRHCEVTSVDPNCMVCFVIIVVEG